VLALQQVQSLLLLRLLLQVQVLLLVSQTSAQMWL
jgi:hypothetical protein